MPLSEYDKQRLAHINAGRPLPEKKRYRIKPISDKRAAKIAEQKKELNGETTDQEQWYAEKMRISEPVCMECGFSAPWLKEPAYEKLWQACQAHILPKKKRFGFPSLATHPDNHLVLFPSWGGHLCGCHGFYDSNWYNASTMKVWEGVKKVFKEKLYLSIPESEKRFIPGVLKKMVYEI